MKNYRPYSPEWHRKRYLQEAIEKYIDKDTDNSVLLEDISDILSERSSRSFADFSKVNDLEHRLHFITNLH